MIKTSIIPFKELTTAGLYELLALRSAVFIVEQQCVYQDVDNHDQIAHHVLMHDDKQLIGCARILPYSDQQSMSFGRLLTVPEYRSKGLGKQLMTLILNYLAEHHPAQAIKITAQLYLQHFYQAYGFKAQGLPFDLDGIPHLLMVKNP